MCKEAAIEAVLLPTTVRKKKGLQGRARPASPRRRLLGRGVATAAWGTVLLTHVSYSTPLPWLQAHPAGRLASRRPGWMPDAVQTVHGLPLQGRDVWRHGFGL